MSLLRSSKWTYSTGATGGVSVDVVVASGGTIVLQDPSQTDQSFYYGGLGAGLGESIKLPRIKLPRFVLPELKLPTINGAEVGGAGSMKSFPSGGEVFMTDAFQGAELTREDIEGGTVYVDAGAGLLVGEGISVMLLGINSAELLLGLTSPAMIGMAVRAIMHAPALLVMGGLTAGLQAGAGIGVLAGYLH